MNAVDDDNDDGDADRGDDDGSLQMLMTRKTAPATTAITATMVSLQNTTWLNIS